MSVSTPTPTGSETRTTTQATPVPDAVRAQVELHDFDRYVVSQNGPVGYVEVVSHVFVCYLGHPYAQAEEIAQVLAFEQAVQIVAGRAASSRQPKLAP